MLLGALSPARVLVSQLAKPAAHHRKHRLDRGEQRLAVLLHVDSDTRGIVERGPPDDIERCPRTFEPVADLEVGRRLNFPVAIAGGLVGGLADVRNQRVETLANARQYRGGGGRGPAHRFLLCRRPREYGL
jgi:hypothetical protein